MQEREREGESRERGRKGLVPKAEVPPSRQKVDITQSGTVKPRFQNSREPTRQLCIPVTLEKSIAMPVCTSSTNIFVTISTLYFNTFINHTHNTDEFDWTTTTPSTWCRLSCGGPASSSRTWSPASPRSITANMLKLTMPSTAFLCWSGPFQFFSRPSTS